MSENNKNFMADFCRNIDYSKVSAGIPQIEVWPNTKHVRQIRFYPFAGEVSEVLPTGYASGRRSNTSVYLNAVMVTLHMAKRAAYTKLFRGDRAIVPTIFLYEVDKAMVTLWDYRTLPEGKFGRDYLLLVRTVEDYIELVEDDEPIPYEVATQVQNLDVVMHTFTKLLDGTVTETLELITLVDWYQAGYGSKFDVIREDGSHDQYMSCYSYLYDKGPFKDVYGRDMNSYYYFTLK